jgi:DNA-binding XRE family transcriptional regulator
MPKTREERLILAGRRLKLARKEYELSQANFAKKIDFSSKSISKWERQGIPRSRLRIVSEFFKLPMLYFMYSKMRDIHFIQTLLQKKKDKTCHG